MPASESLVLKLVGKELASVVFVRDYVQLDFDGPRLSAFVWPRLRAFGVVWAFGDRGYRDALCGLIGRTVTAATDSPDLGVVCWFDSDMLIIKPEGSELGGPEIATLQLNDDAQQWEVWRPGEGSFQSGDW